MSENPSAKDDIEFGPTLLRVCTAFAVVYLALGFAADSLVFILPTLRDGYIIGVCVSLAFHILAWVALFHIARLYRPEPEPGLLGPYTPSLRMTRYYKVWAIFALLLGIQSGIGHIITSERFNTQVYALHDTTLFFEYDICCAMYLPYWVNYFYWDDAYDRAFIMLLVQILLVHVIAFFLSHFHFARRQPMANWYAARSLAWAIAFSVLSLVLLLHFYHSVLYAPPLPISTL